jgi:acyl carrier protein|tara:strand:+ start:23 stop:241 length:219 start_codon:yes stop_codon:yes gene_type:complete
MKKNDIIHEVSEILMLDEDFNVDETQIEFDSLSSLMLVEFLDSNFNITVTKDEIKSFKTIKSVLIFIDDKRY